MEFFKTVTSAIKGAMAGVASVGVSGLVTGVVVPAVGTLVINASSKRALSMNHAVIHTGIGTTTLSSATGLVGGAVIGGMYANGFFQKDTSDLYFLQRKPFISAATLAFCFFNLLGGIAGNAMIAPTEVNHPNNPIPSDSDITLVNTIGILLTLPVVVGILFLVTKPSQVREPKPGWPEPPVPMNTIA